MNKNLMIGIVIAVIVLIGGFMFLNNGIAPAGNNGEPPTNGETLSASIDDLLAFSGTKTCTFSDEGVSGTVYVSNGKMRGDFEATENGQVLTTHMVRADGYQYVWVDGQGGLKIKEADLKKFETQANQGNNQTPDLNERVNYTCQNWSGDSAKFAVPTDVEFNDFGALFEGLGMPVPGNENIEETIVTDETPGAGAQCAVCNQLPAGEQRNACLQALGC